MKSPMKQDIPGEHAFIEMKTDIMLSNCWYEEGFVRMECVPQFKNPFHLHIFGVLTTDDGKHISSESKIWMTKAQMQQLRNAIDEMLEGGF